MDVRRKLGRSGSTRPMVLRVDVETRLNQRKQKMDSGQCRKVGRRQAVSRLMGVKQCMQLSNFNELVKKQAERKQDINEQRTLVRYVKKSLKNMCQSDRDVVLREVRCLLRMVQGATLTQIHFNLQQHEIKQECSLNHTITNLLFYQLCAETLLALQLSDKSLRYLKNCQYFSRILKYDKYTLELCFKIAETHKDRHEYKHCTVFLENALELAVELRDRYLEMKALDNLGMCYYYKGNARVANYYHTQMDTLDDSLQGEFCNASELFLRKEPKSQAPTLDLDEVQTLRQPFYFGLKHALESNYDHSNRQNAENLSRELIRYPVFHKALSKIKQYMSREQSIGQISRGSKSNATLPLRKQPRQNQGTDLLNQVLLTHRSRRDHRKRNLNVSLTRELSKLVGQLSYIEGLCADY